MSTYAQAVEHLYALGHELARTPTHKFDLAHMRALAAALGHPEQRFRSVLIAGTNGKGSTAATLASILRAAGHRTALYTSPHLLRVNERIQVDGEPICDADFAATYDRVEAAAARLVAAGELPWHPSFFEMLTAMAFQYFAAGGLEIAVLEVGMGGRLDATNIVEPIVAVITDIALDHQKFLGDTIAAIAGEKAGIIHERGTVVLLPQHPQANDVLGRAVVERHAKAISAVPYIPPVSPNAPSHIVEATVPLVAPPFSGAPFATERVGTARTALAEPALRHRYPLSVLGEEIEVDSPLVGRHQLRNLALAIAGAVELNQHGIAVSARNIEEGVRQTRWPGRFQLIAGEPTVVLDVAHNPAGAWALRSALSERFPERPLVLVFGAMRDKAVGEMAEILFPIADRVFATQADNPRSASPAEVAEAAARTGAEIVQGPSVAAAIARARREASANSVVVITGSIFVVGEALAALGLG